MESATITLCLTVWGFCFGCGKTVGCENSISRVWCYPPPKSPSCEGDLSLCSTNGICYHNPMPDGVGFLFWLW